MNAEVIGGEVAAAAEHIAALANAPRSEVDSGAHCVARTVWPSDELQLHPVVMVWNYISKERWKLVNVVDDDIDLAVVEEVSKKRLHDPR